MRAKCSRNFGIRHAQVRAIGAGGAWVLATEIFGWRAIRNGRELGALVGLAPALYQSGATQRDRGITRAGNAHVRRMMVQLAWGWLRWQSDSVLAQWYQRRFATGGSRQAGHWDRRVGAETSARPVALCGSSYRA